MREAIAEALRDAGGEPLRVEAIQERLGWGSPWGCKLALGRLVDEGLAVALKFGPRWAWAADHEAWLRRHYEADPCGRFRTFDEWARREYPRGEP